MVMMKKKITPVLLLQFLIISAVALISACSTNETDQQAENGRFFVDPSHTGVKKLSGDWELYWGNLYTPDDFPQIQDKPIYAHIPDPWTSIRMEGNKLPQTGYGTYRLLIKFPDREMGTMKALYITGVSSSYKLWINGKFMLENGAVGKTKGETEAINVPRVIQFPVHSNDAELIMQVANFHQRKAGLTGPVYMGETGEILEIREKKLLFRSLIVISLAVMGLYHFALFTFHRKELNPIFFGAACLLIAIRVAFQDGALAHYLLPFLSWEAGNKFEYAGASLGILFFSLFTFTQYPEVMKIKMRNIIVFIMGAYSLFVMLTPSIIFTKTMIFFQLLVICTFGYFMHVSVKAMLQKQDGSLLNAFAYLLFFIAILNDTLFFNHVIQTTELASVGLFFFLFIQSFIMSKRYANSFKKTEMLSRDLFELNASLEQKVKRRTRELREINAQLQAANEMLESGHQSRSRWIRNISHEIATPLTNVRAYTKGMLDGVIPADREYIGLVYEQSVYLSRMLDDLHDMTEMENRHMKMKMDKVNIRLFIRQLYEKYRITIKKQGIDFTFADLLPAGTEHFVLMDTLRIEQVILNLLTNAEKSIEEKGKIILELAAANEKNMVEIRVKDNGTGIGEADLHLVFERFYRGKKRKGNDTGSGLGLAISREIIELHKGTIGVSSKEGEGSCFYFTLPLLDPKPKGAVKK
jgi:signal transduction histidine kinase